MLKPKPRPQVRLVGRAATVHCRQRCWMRGQPVSKPGRQNMHSPRKEGLPRLLQQEHAPSECGNTAPFRERPCSQIQQSEQERGRYYDCIPDRCSPCAVVASPLSTPAA
eukprot:scaffold2790_cov122-Isochrysis_galbana.AAC.2